MTHPADDSPQAEMKATLGEIASEKKKAREAKKAKKQEAAAAAAQKPVAVPQPSTEVTSEAPALESEIPSIHTPDGVQGADVQESALVDKKEHKTMNFTTEQKAELQEMFATAIKNQPAPQAPPQGPGQQQGVQLQSGGLAPDLIMRELMARGLTHEQAGTIVAGKGVPVSEVPHRVLENINRSMGENVTTFKMDTTSMVIGGVVTLVVVGGLLTINYLLQPATT